MANRTIEHKDSTIMIIGAVLVALGASLGVTEHKTAALASDNHQSIVYMQGAIEAVDSCHERRRTATLRGENTWYKELDAARHLPKGSVRDAAVQKAYDDRNRIEAEKRLVCKPLNLVAPTPEPVPTPTGQV